MTSDHDTGYLWGPGSNVTVPSFPGDPATWVPVVNNGEGAMPGFGFFSTFDVGKGSSGIRMRWSRCGRRVPAPSDSNP